MRKILFIVLMMINFPAYSEELVSKDKFKFMGSSRKSSIDDIISAVREEENKKDYFNKDVKGSVLRGVAGTIYTDDDGIKRKVSEDMGEDWRYNESEDFWWRYTNPSPVPQLPLMNLPTSDVFVPRAMPSPTYIPPQVMAIPIRTSIPTSSITCTSRG